MPFSDWLSVLLNIISSSEVVDKVAIASLCFQAVCVELRNLCWRSITKATRLAEHVDCTRERN